MSVKEKSAPVDKGAVAEKNSSGAAPAAAAGPVDYPTFLAKLGAKDRLNIERHVAACEAEPDGGAHANNYRRLVTVMAGLAPQSSKTHGQQAVQFYIPDGKYRMQVFALQDQRDGVMAIYCEDVLDAAVKAGLVSGPHEVGDQNNSYRIKGSIDSLRIDQLDGKSANPSPYYKDMLGWNRRALRITTSASATPDQIAAVEKLCVMAAKKWAGKA